MGMNMKWCVAMCALALTGSALAQTNRNGRPMLGVELGVYLPQDSLIRDRFGSSLLRVGVGYLANRRSLARKFTPEFGLISANNNGNRLLIIPVTLGYEFHFTRPGDEEQNTIPYARLAAGLAYYDYDVSTGPGTRARSRRIAPTGTLEGGLIIGDNLRLSARYYLFSETDGLNFSGLQFSLTYGFIRI